MKRSLPLVPDEPILYHLRVSRARSRAAKLLSATLDRILRMPLDLNLHFAFFPGIKLGFRLEIEKRTDYLHLFSLYVKNMTPRPFSISHACVKLPTTC